ncbi:restriction endonuclease subunit S [Rhizobium sp. Leaf386]|uniref:restriction endonuclease subunit S n=1 Tax=Rhizobium sp. Leaf386 TaxID=1736359 RepID=UPI0007132897|nr:restriction endonuclease subunit S [Rhizobium sp. Leaf386]KQT07006.1 hypothetical protein ASG50_00815 [Rhizobium sp. Leaf386]
MSRKVPEGWSLKRLGEMMEFQNGFAFKPADWGSSGLPIVRIQNLNGGGDFNFYDGYVPAQFGIKSGDILFCWSGSRGTSFGPRRWKGSQGWLNQHIFRCDLGPAIDGEFAFYLLEHLTEAIEQAAHGGAGLVHIKKSELVKFDAAMPPLNEQRRMAEILSSVDEAIAATRAVIEQTRKVKQGVLERMLTKGIGHTRFKQTEVGEIPEGWEVDLVENNFLVQLGKMLSKAAKSGSEPSPYLRNANVQWGRIDTDDVLSMDFSKSEKEKFRLKAGDLLVCEGGEVGRSAIWNGDREMYFQKALHRLREKSGAVTNQFLYFYLQFFFHSEKLSGGIIGKNSIPHFTREKFLKLNIPVPTVREQSQIVQTLLQFEAAVEQNEQALQRLQDTKSALMSDLLTGRKRVTDALLLAAE